MAIPCLIYLGAAGQALAHDFDDQKKPTGRTRLLDIEFNILRADNFRMGHKKVIALLLGLCVLLAPVLSSASVFALVPEAQAQETQAHCHGVKILPEHGTQNSVYKTGTKAAHACCFNLVGILSATDVIKVDSGTNEFIPFSPSLSLSYRAEGFYRPPRQIS